MKRLILLAALATPMFAAAADPPVSSWSGVGGGGVAPKAGKTESDRFQGKWKVVELAYDGAKITGDDLKDSTWEFRGNQVIADGDEKGSATFAVDASTDPAQIDIIAKNKQVNRGIYKFEGDKLTICTAVEGETRPTKFVSGKGKDSVVIVLQRKK